MNIEVARHKSVIANPTASSERKESALAALTDIASSGSDPRSQDAGLVLAELGISLPEPPVENTENEPAEDLDWNWFYKLRDKQISEDHAFYEKAKSDGLSAAETVTKMRDQDGPHAAMKYGIIFEQAAMCKRDGAYAARTYFCPVIYKMLKEIEQWSPHDWPAIELATATLAEYQYQPQVSFQSTGT